MEKSKIIDLLRTFTKEERSDFTDFIASPYYNKRKELIPFYAYLKDQSPTFPSELINRKQVFSAVYPDLAYNEKQLGYLMSYLTKLAEQFMVVKKSEEDIMLKQSQLQSTLIERKLYKYYEQENRKAAKELSETLLRNTNYYYGQYKYYENAAHHFSIQEQRKYDANLQKVVDYLDNFYLLAKLKWSCAMIDMQKFLAASYELNFLDEIKAYLSERNLDNEPVINIYYNIINIITEDNEDLHFEQLKPLIKNSKSTLTKKELEEVYIYAINHCARKLRKGEVEYIEEAFNLYVDGIEIGVFVEDNYLSPWTYTNVVKLGLRLKNYDYIEKFIHQYSNQLPENFRKNAFHYNLAELHYYTKNFDEAITHLNKVKFSDLNFHLGSRVMLAKIYYELEEEEVLLSLIASFSIFLKRNKNISNDLKKTYINFLDILNRLLRRNPKKMAAIKEKISSTELLTDRSWLQSIYEKEHARIATT